MVRANEGRLLGRARVSTGPRKALARLLRGTAVEGEKSPPSGQLEGLKTERFAHVRIAQGENAGVPKGI